MMFLTSLSYLPHPTSVASWLFASDNLPAEGKKKSNKVYKVLYDMVALALKGLL